MGLVHSAARCLGSPLRPRAENLKHTFLSGGHWLGRCWAELRKTSEAAQGSPKLGPTAQLSAGADGVASFLLGGGCLRMQGC